MTLSTGTKLSHYEITSQIGKGGMGEVYQAKDQKLGRDVAIKVLPEEFARDADLVARFQREAKLLALLNHPNIAAIYGLEEAEGVHFLVMELIEGQTLDDRIKAGAIHVEESLKLALQIAEALEAAHEKGVIHRDLKPANIKVTSDGKVKVLDFGLAKAVAADGAEKDLSQSQTISKTLTIEGTLQGTPAYMSPQQVRGERVDRQSDIWAFGCILYEMLSGRRLFHGDTLSDILGRILAKDPEWNSLPPELYPRIRFLLERCLEKNTQDRCHDIADAGADIRKVLAHPDHETIRPAVGTVRAGRPSKTGWLTAVLFGIIALGLVLWTTTFRGWITPGRGSTSFTQVDIALLPGHTLRKADTMEFAVSPDGGHVAYFSSQGSRIELYLRAADASNSKTVPSSMGGTTPFFSRDGKWLAFFADGKLRKVPVVGGSPKDICSASSNRGAVWLPDDTIVFAPEDGPLMRVPSEGGVPEQISFLDTSKGEISHRWPGLLPGGYIIFTAGSGGNWDDAEIVAQSLETSERHFLIGGTDGSYAPTGHLILARNRTLMAAPFSPDEIRVIGDAVAVVENVAQSPFSGVAQYAFSDTGTLAYSRSEPYGTGELVWMDLEGNIESVGLAPGLYGNPRVSPDGTRVAIEFSGARDQIGIYDLNSGVLEQITFEGLNQLPIWSWDSRRVTFQSNREKGMYNIYWTVWDRSQKPEPLTVPGTRQTPGSWSSNQILAFVKDDPNTGSDIWTVRPGEGEKPFLNKPYSEWSPAFSPDGNWLAYTSNEEGKDEVYVTSFPKSGAKIKISNEGGTNPVWSQDGTKLFYRNGDRMMVVDAMGRSGFRRASPQLLFEIDKTINHIGNIGPDGRFIAKRSSSPTPTNHIDLSLNWFDELKQKVQVP
jgi:Tol biopolymer transport system component/predicted Ser/Thr protein kinase